MSFATNHPIPPEIILADRILAHIPRLGKIRKGDLFNAIYRKNAKEYTSHRDYLEVALEILHTEKYIDVTVHNDDNNTGIQYCLTNAGRMLQDSGGYLK